MPLARYSGVAFVVDADDHVVIAPLASVAVRREDSGALASLFSDRDGASGLANPLTADDEGRFSFHAAGLEDGYRVTVTEAGSPGLSHALRYVPVGTLAELDNPISAEGDLIIGGSGAVMARKAVGSDGYPLVPSSAASGKLVWAPPGLGFNLVGGYLDWSTVGSPTSTLLVAIKTWAGNDPSDAEPVFIAFRSSTAGNGAIVYRKITAATSITINSSALLGTRSNVPFRLWCVAFDDGGTIRLAVVNCVATVAGAGTGSDVTGIYPLGGWGIASATQESDTADSAQTFYSDGAAVASKAYATLGFATWETGLPNAGNWNSDPTREQLYGPGVPLPSQPVQSQRTPTGASSTTSVTTPAQDDSIPQITEGTQFMAQAITPTSAANVINVKALGWFSVDDAGAGGLLTWAMFKDAVSNALCAASSQLGADAAINTLAPCPLEHRILAAGTAAQTYSYRAGVPNGTTGRFNGAANSATRHFGGVCNSFIEAEEIMG